MKRLFYSLCGINYKAFVSVATKKKERKHFLFFCLSFLCSCIFNFTGTFVLLLETTEIYWLTFTGATLWTFIYYVIFRLVLVVTLNKSKISFGRFLSILFISSLLIVLSSFSFSGMFFFLDSILGNIEKETIYSLIEIVNEIKNHITNGSPYIITKAIILPLIILFPFLIVSFSNAIRKGEYLEFLADQQKEIILANYKNFKKLYQKKLRASVFQGVNFGDKFKRDNEFQFYEGFEDPPFNKSPKKEW